MVAGLCRSLCFHPEQAHLKLVTYNVNWGFVNPSNVTDFLAETDADIVCLQETNRYWQAALESQLVSVYPYRFFREFGGTGGIAVMSKYKLRNVKLIEPGEGWFPALFAEADTSIGSIQLLNVHLRPSLSNNASATLSAYYNAPNIHIKELQAFLKHASADRPLVVMGDFNENESKDGINWLEAQGFY